MQRQEEESTIANERRAEKLTLYDIITNEDTLEFLESNFAHQSQITIKDFFKTVLNTYDIDFSSTSETK